MSSDPYQRTLSPWWEHHLKNAQVPYKRRGQKLEVPRWAHVVLYACRDTLKERPGWTTDAWTSKVWRVWRWTTLDPTRPALVEAVLMLGGWDAVWKLVPPLEDLQSSLHSLTLCVISGLSCCRR